MEKAKKDYKPERDKFLPIDREDMQKRDWEELDFLVISGDAYVDHPSFGHAIISRWLEKLGFRVGIIAQPDWRSTDDFKRMGRPRLGVMVTAGNLDSMLNHYTASGKKRKTDPYSPGGAGGLRPDRATIVYCNRVRELWKDVPLIIGGIEASLRRMAHYDYWGNDVRRSILADSRADLLVFGMGELPVTEIARALSEGREVSQIRDVPGTCWKTHDPGNAADAVLLPSFEEVRSDKKVFAQAFKKFYLEQNHSRGNRLIQDQGAWNVVQNRPARPMTEKEMDKVYNLPYTRAAHPSYDEAGGVPALEEVRFSITSHRGCFGECSFCAIAMHQGRIIQTRSDKSMIEEASSFKKMKDFKGYVHDVGGPTANFVVPSCPDQEKKGTCTGKSCLYPGPCKKLEADHTRYIGLLRKLREIPGIKKVFIRSGLRYDYILEDKKTEFLDELCRYHVSGQLKIAPEHVSPAVLKFMKKVPRNVTVEFIEAYRKKNRELGLKQFLVPYFMSSHPGSTLKEAVDLAEFIRDSGLRPEQVQDFTPTPGSVSTCMYYTGIDPMTGEDVYVPRDHEERNMQRSLLQYWVPENAGTVKKALIKAGREDLIGNDSKCLVQEHGFRRRMVK
ncbi:MAG: YgiQ family radical SAM protein [Synergistaceae bacterium]|nr:YgiQ family radical SAM protein [Synergistaceae bacterium]MDD2350281.1 YgiQ family radical SAM protein [Synergistaceae bacterium]MDD3319365.1 YgiQ family radical SAM protein [Synergistaceae bacterium]MDD3672031.1 YgiQ family radical SAM protein [Synergistaceae bacterium]MDD3963565.1 YgiQ family radical SAM protein [Synergistaceae bacterium]